MLVVLGYRQRGIKDPSLAPINEKRPYEIFSITFVGHSSQSSVSPAFNGVQDYSANHTCAKVRFRLNFVTLHNVHNHM